MRSRGRDRGFLRFSGIRKDLYSQAEGRWTRSTGKRKRKIRGRRREKRDRVN